MVKKDDVLTRKTRSKCGKPGHGKRDNKGDRNFQSSLYQLQQCMQQSYNLINCVQCQAIQIFLLQTYAYFYTNIMKVSQTLVLFTLSSASLAKFCPFGYIKCSYSGYGCIISCWPSCICRNSVQPADAKETFTLQSHDCKNPFNLGTYVTMCYNQRRIVRMLQCGLAGSTEQYSQGLSLHKLLGMSRTIGSRGSINRTQLKYKGLKPLRYILLKSHCKRRRQLTVS